MPSLDRLLDSFINQYLPSLTASREKACNSTTWQWERYKERGVVRVCLLKCVSRTVSQMHGEYGGWPGVLRMDAASETTCSQGPIRMLPLTPPSCSAGGPQACTQRPCPSLLLPARSQDAQSHTQRVPSRAAGVLNTAFCFLNSNPPPRQQGFSGALVLLLLLGCAWACSCSQGQGQRC